MSSQDVKDAAVSLKVRSQVSVHPYVRILPVPVRCFKWHWHCFKPESTLLLSKDHGELTFKIKRHAPLKKIIDAWCHKKSLVEAEFVFLYESTRVRPELTPDDLEVSVA